MTGREPLRLVPPVTPIWSGAADVLQTATDAHREIDRIERESPSPHGDEPTNQRGDWQGQTPLLGRAISQSRARKARRHNLIGAVVGVVLLIVALFIVFTAAAGISIARADTADDWASIYAPAVCDTLDSYPTVSGLTGVLIAAQQHSALTDEQAGEAVGISVMTRCPEYRRLLAEFVRRYGPVVA